MKKSKLLLVLTVLTYIFLIGPMLVMIGTAFNAGSALAFPPTGFSLQWFEKAFSSPSFIEGFKTSFVVSLGGTLLAMLLGVPASVSTFDSLDAELRLARQRAALTFLEIKCAIGAREDLGRPTTTAKENKENFMEGLRGRPLL